MKAPPPPRSARQPQRKMFLAFRICAHPIFSKKERTFFFGVLPSKYSGSVAGLQFGLGKAESIFSGEKDFRFTSADFPRGGGVWGGIRAGFGFRFQRLQKREEN